MGRHFKRRADSNQAEMVADLEADAYQVIHTFRHGDEAPDIIVAHRARPGVNLLVEVKKPGEARMSATAKRDARKRRQAETRAGWPGAYIQATTAAEVRAWFEALPPTVRPLA